MLKNIVLIHGWGAKTESLIPLKKELLGLGWRVFLIKLPGFGRPAPKKVWGLKEYSDYVLKKAEKRFSKVKFFVFGHSFGGAIALKLALNHKRDLYGIILCETRGISRTIFLKRLVFILVAKLGKVFLIYPKIAKNFRRLLYKLAREHDYEKTQGIMREIFKKVVNEDLKDSVSKIKIPVLILWGEKDKMTPIKDAFFLKSRILGSKLVVFENQGHRLPYEDPKKVALEINSWQKQIFSH